MQSDEEWIVDASEVKDEMDGILEGMEKAKPRWKKAAAILGAIVVILLIADGALGAVLLFTHNLPATPAASAPAISTQCTALGAQSSSTVQGTAGTVLYSCTSAAPSFSATGSPAIPTFSAPSGLTLSAVAYVASAASCSGGTPLSSGVSISLAAGSYDYCGAFSNYPSSGFASFTVSWSQ